MASLACVWFPELSVQKAIWARRRERHAFTFRMRAACMSHLPPALKREMKKRVQSHLYPAKAAQKLHLKQLKYPKKGRGRLYLEKTNVMSYGDVQNEMKMIFF